MNTPLLSVLRQSMRSALIAAVPLVLVPALLTSASPALGQQPRHFTVSEQQRQNQEAFLTELASLGLLDAPFGQSVQLVMTCLIQDDFVTYYGTAVPQEEAEFLKLDLQTQATIEEFAAGQPTPAPQMDPTSSCTIWCAHGTCTISDTNCSCYCDILGHPHCSCNSPIEVSTWGTVKAVYR